MIEILRLKRLGKDMFMKRSILVLSLLFVWIACSEKSEIAVPEKIGHQEKARVISGTEAIKIIDEMHGLAVAPRANIIAEYGNKPKDVLYISYYAEQEDAQKAFKLMIDKMLKAENGPFSHVRILNGYDERVYIALGMGAVHYIYRSTHYLLWLQTYQKIGRELPEALLSLYPI